MWNTTKPSPVTSLISLGIKAKNNIMGVSTSLAVIKMITQLKHFAWLSKGLFDNLNPNQEHLVLLLTVWLILIAYVITPANVGLKNTNRIRPVLYNETLFQQNTGKTEMLLHSRKLVMNLAT